MDRQEIAGQLEPVIEGYIKPLGFELVELVSFRQSGDLVLRVLADKPSGGITMEDCGRLNFEIRRHLEESDPALQNCVLEVSSPGLDRPLKKEKDFIRSLGKKAVFYLNDTVEGALQQEGVIIKVAEGRVYIEKAGNILQVPMAKIAKAKTII
jgi:ribosome maturation factor RimP